MQMIAGLPVIPSAELMDQRELSSGAFGKVLVAKRSGRGRVVVKTTKVGTLDRASIDKELRFLRDMSGHTNVARILALCLDLAGGDLGIVMDYCEYGSLKSFLRNFASVRSLVVMFIAWLHTLMLL